MKNLYITCKSGTDGFGAQYHRILGVYAICKEYGIKYIHTPIKSIDYQGLVSLENNTYYTDYVNRCNERINLVSDKKMEENLVFREIVLNKYKEQQLYSLRGPYISIHYPFRITDSNPEIYNHVKGTYIVKIPKNKVFTIGIHVRRGELLVVDSDRMLPNKYYIDIANKLINICRENNVDFIVELYTEVASKDVIITPNHVGINFRISNNIIVKSTDSAIEDFNVLPNLVKYINEDTLDTLDRMINSDILIMSRSSFSACAAYLKEGISIYKPFWHKLPSKNISSDDKNFNIKVLEYIKNYIKNNFEKYMIVYSKSQARLNNYNNIKNNIIKDLNMFEAIDTVNNYDYYSKFSIDNNYSSLKYNNDNINIKGKLGCNLSHILLLKHFVEKSHKDWLLVLEDDVEIIDWDNNNLYQIIDIANKNNSHYIQLYTHNVFLGEQLKQPKIANNLYKMIPQWGTVSYLISKFGAKLLLNSIPLTDHIDHVYRKLIKPLNSLCYIQNYIKNGGCGTSEDIDNHKFGSIILNINI